jgi:hypothetical protein
VLQHSEVVAVTGLVTGVTGTNKNQVLYWLPYARSLMGRQWTASVVSNTSGKSGAIDGGRKFRL